MTESITRSTAEARVGSYLASLEAGINDFGSSLPGAENRAVVRLAIWSSKTQEHDFGWVFFYNSAEFIESGAFRSSLVGHGPLIVPRDDGLIYPTGSAYPIDHWIKQYREGRLTPVSRPT